MVQSIDNRDDHIYDDVDDHHFNYQDGAKHRVHDLAREARDDDTMDCDVCIHLLQS